MLDRGASNIARTPLDTPRPLIGRLPHKDIASEVDLHIARALHPDRRKHVVVVLRHEDARERGWKRYTVVGEEQTPAGELVAAADDVARAEAREDAAGVVVASAVWIFKEFAEVIEVEGGGEAIPAWVPPFGIGAASSSCDGDEWLVRCKVAGRNSPIVTIPSIW